MRAVLVLTLPVLLAAGPAGVASAESRAVRHSGRVAAIDPARHTLSLEELGPWTGPATRPITLKVELTPKTTVALDRRSTTAASDGGWPGGYVASPLKIEDIRPGDFATVSTDRQGRRLVATSIEVVRPAGD